MKTRVGLFLGGRGGVVPSSIEIPPTRLTVATLVLEPMESLLEATLNFEGEDVPLFLQCTSHA